LIPSPVVESLSPVVLSAPVLTPVVELVDVVVAENKSSQMTVIHTASEVPMFKATFTSALVKQWTHKVLSPDFNIPFLECILPDAYVIIELRINMYDIALSVVLPSFSWKSLCKEDFCKKILLAYSDVMVGSALDSSLTAQINNLFLAFSMQDQQVEFATAVSLCRLEAEFPLITAKEQLEAVSLLLLKLPDKPVSWRSRFLADSVRPVTISAFALRFLTLMKASRTHALNLVALDCSVVYGTNSRQLNPSARISKRAPEPEEAEVSKKPRVPPPSSAPHVSCWGCGRPNHKKTVCQHASHPDFNSSPMAWSVSVNGLAWKAVGHDILPSHRTLSGSVWHLPAKESSEKTSSSSSSSSASSSSKSGESLIANLLSFISDKLSSNFIPCTLSLPFQETSIKENKSNFLVDTGSLAGNFISSSLVSKFKFSKFIKSDLSQTVCSGLDNSCLNLS
jgi:hypothetical protein